MTFQILYNETFRLLRDTGKTKYDLVTIKRWVNDGEKRFCTFTGFSRKKRTSISLVASTQEYSLPSDFLSPIAIFSDGKPLVEKKIEDTIFETTETGEPCWYYTTNDKIGFYPVPDSSSYTITEIYNSMGGAMSDDGDTPIIPSNYHDLLPMWAAYKGGIEGEDSRTATFKSFWDEGLILAVPKITQRNLGQMQIEVGRQGGEGISGYDHDLGAI